jgi:hypothetical protein
MPPYSGEGGELLRAYMREHCLRAEDVSSQLGTSHATVCRWLFDGVRPRSSTRLEIHRWSNGFIPTDSWGEVVYPPDIPRESLPPVVRGLCDELPRPCPRWACRYHLFGEIKDGHETEQSCALDIADEGEHTLQEVGETLGITRERVRQIESRALRKLRRRGTTSQNIDK